MALLGKGKEKQTVQIRVKAQHSKITRQTFHEVNNHKINRAAKCHCSSQLKRTDQCSMQINKKVKQSHYRPAQAQRVLRKLMFPDFITTAQDCGKVVSLKHRPPLPPGNIPGTNFC